MALFFYIMECDRGTDGAAFICRNATGTASPMCFPVMGTGDYATMKECTDVCV